MWSLMREACYKPNKNTIFNSYVFARFDEPKNRFEQNVFRRCLNNCPRNKRC